MEEQQQQQKHPLSLDRDTLIDDAPPAELVMKPSAMATDQAPLVDGLYRLNDYDLEENIRRKKRLLETTGKNLPGGGAKLRATIKLYEEERSRRKVNPHPQQAAHIPTSSTLPPPGVPKSAQEAKEASETKMLGKMERHLKRTKTLQKQILESQRIIQQEIRYNAARFEMYQALLMQHILPRVAPNLQLPVLAPPQIFPDVPAPAQSDSSDDSSPSK